MQGVNSQQEVVATEELDDPVGLAISGDRNPADQDLLGVSVSSIDEAYEVYNDYAFSYLKVDVRTGCRASVQFDLDGNGMWTVTKHQKLHNHEFVPTTKSYLLRSHRSVSRNHLSYLKDLKKSGVCVADGLRFLKTQSGGSPLVGFTSRDAYNSLCTDVLNNLDGTDSNTLIEIFRQRQSSEKDFFFDFEVDDESRLCSFFWRDGKMMRDYELFGDLLVHDTTYHTNKYDMICGPFVGMNHHCMNVMFGCGFLLNERIELFVWLFRSFLRSMNGKSPQSIMTDQCAAMAAAISQIRRQSLSFIGQVLVTTYKCHNNSWIEKLYQCREKWCPAFNKDYFSGGILSSQRSETTNHSISRRLSKTVGLCDFYSSFVGVVSEWRSRENGEDVRCSQGVPTMAMDHIKILSHARDIYTIEIYYLFEEQFLKGASCYQDCKLFTETGILCCHCLRILNVHCVSEVPNKYILKRWTKRVLEDENAGIVPPSQCFNVPSSVWTLEITRKFQKLVVYCQENNEARKIFEQAVLDAKRKVEHEYGPIFFEGEDCDVESSSGVIKDPSNRRLNAIGG
ncbi:protein FAR1-RELATED SEQUENCE 5-like [Ipomoea triloba]|uniref:protein FAR1-RELATED SEQUENCE 5-like n=1 Tax=Ipomoea triloba TaxID=35885 RepID=UPI00125E14C9|nr:protein FAR1-RELATED SEQUENCE 5-like [Ipomoea triloba]